VAVRRRRRRTRLLGEVAVLQLRGPRLQVPPLQLTLSWKKKSKEGGDEGEDGEEEAKAPETPKPVTTTEAIQKLKQQEVSVRASTKVHIRT